MPISDNTVVIKPGVYTVPTGSTIQGNTFVGAGTYTITPTYTRTDIAWGGNTPNVNAKETSLSADKIIESLFRLNPAARTKYENDKSKFAEALIAAGEAAYQKQALQDLRTLNVANDL